MDDDRGSRPHRTTARFTRRAVIRLSSGLLLAGPTLGTTIRSAGGAPATPDATPGSASPFARMPGERVRAIRGIQALRAGEIQADVYVLNVYQFDGARHAEAAYRRLTADSEANLPMVPGDARYTPLTAPPVGTARTAERVDVIAGEQGTTVVSLTAWGAHTVHLWLLASVSPVPFGGEPRSESDIATWTANFLSLAETAMRFTDAELSEDAAVFALLPPVADIPFAIEPAMEAIWWQDARPQASPSPSR